MKFYLRKRCSTVLKLKRHLNNFNQSLVISFSENKSVKFKYSLSDGGRPGVLWRLKTESHDGKQHKEDEIKYWKQKEGKKFGLGVGTWQNLINSLPGDL